MPVKKGQALGFIHHERTKYGCKDKGVLLLKQYHKHGIFLCGIFPDYGFLEPLKTQKSRLSAKGKSGAY
jgi:ssDNA-binding Zn-finger/Zn-ribbon topoisomerase 1